MASSRNRARTVDQLVKFTEISVRRLQLRVFQTVVSATPVLTGFARAGWSPSTGVGRASLDVSPLEATGVARKTLEEFARTQAATVAGLNAREAERIASTYRLSQGPVFIVNNVRYITYLNEGSSAQAPANFVEEAVATAVRATEREVQALANRQ